MSKNLTRKGIAFGAAFALGSTLLAGAPAFAAAELNLQPTTGTEYTMIEGEAFSLKSFGNNEFLASNGSGIRFKVKNVSASAETAASATVNGAALATLDTGLPARTETKYYRHAAAMTSPSTLEITSSALATTKSLVLEVTAFVDTDGSGTISTGELVSPTRTVTWVALEDVSPVITGNGFADDGSFGVTVSLGDVNEAQLTAAEFDFAWMKDNTTVVASDNTAALTLNAAETALTGTLSSAALASTEVFSVRALHDSNGDTAAGTTTLLGSVVTNLSVSARTVADANVVGLVVAGANAKSSGTETADVRLNSEYVARVSVLNGTTALPGVGTTATLATSVSLSASKFITVNGTKYESATALSAASIAGTSSTTGYSALTVSTTGFATDDTVTITWKVQGITAQLVATSKKAVYSIFPTTGLEADNSGYDPEIAIGSSYTAKYVVADQWGVAPADNAYTVTLARATNGTARTTAASFVKAGTVAGGKVEFAITDNGAGSGADDVTATLYGSSVAATGSSSSQTGDVVFTLKYGVAANFTPAALTVTDNQDVASASEDGDVAINSAALPNWNYYTAGSTAEPTVDAANSTNNIDTDETLTISGVVTNAAGVGISTTPVTVTAPGITFIWTDGNSKKVYSRDSITVLSSAGGSYSVVARSDAKGGAVVFTAAAGSLSKTTTVTFAQGTAKGLAVSAPVVYGAGRTVDVAIKVTDANGSPVAGVAVTLKSTGAGYLNSQSGTTDANGDVNVKLITLAGDKGAAVVSATATIDGVVTTKATTVYVAAKVTIVKAATSTVVVKNVKGATVKVVRGSKTATKVATSSSQKITLKGGTGTVKVYVNGVKVASK